LRDYSIAYEANPAAYKVDRRPYERTMTHADVVHEPGKCIACGLCVQITEKAREPLGLTYIGRGFKVRIGVPFDQKLSEALRQVGAECVAACPTGALTLRGQRHVAEPSPGACPPSPGSAAARTKPSAASVDMAPEKQGADPSQRR
jgi:NADH dehydrogenase/NADH:ubiquinone oxidoreductase subunit G